MAVLGHSDVNSKDAHEQFTVTWDSRLLRPMMNALRELLSPLNFTCQFLCNGVNRLRVWIIWIRDECLGAGY